MSKFKNMKLRYKVATGVATTAAVVGLGGAAFAYFTATGSNTSGAGSVGSATAWTVNQPAAVGSALYPAQGSQSFAFTVTNNSNGTQGLQSVTAVVNPTNSGCSADWYNVSIDAGSATAASGAGNATETYAAPIEIAKGSDQSVSVVLSLTDENTNQNACEGDTPTITLTAN